MMGRAAGRMIFQWRCAAINLPTVHVPHCAWPFEIVLFSNFIAVTVTISKRNKTNPNDSHGRNTI